MKSKVLCFFLAAASSAFSQTYSFVYDNVTRNYIVHLPAGYVAGHKYPLVLNLHGYTSNASQQETYSQMDAVADTANFIAVYPNGVNTAWNAFGPPGGSGVKDVGFLSALIDTMKKNFGADSLRVYACGLSNGGFMSYRLACELQNKIAAIAPVAGLIGDTVRQFCQGSCPVPVLDMQGTSDPLVNYNGSTGYVSVDSTIRIWRGKDGCPASPVVTNFPDVNASDGCKVTKYYYGPCANSSEVILYKITGGGHTWPGAVAIPAAGNTNEDISASGEIWNFFRKHSLKCATSAVAEVNPSSGISVYPNPTDKVVLVSGLYPGALSLYNSLGEKVYSFRINGKEHRIQIDGASGIYFLKMEAGEKVFVCKIIKD